MIVISPSPNPEGDITRVIPHELLQLLASYCVCVCERERERVCVEERNCVVGVCPRAPVAVGVGKRVRGKETEGVCSCVCARPHVHGCMSACLDVCVCVYVHTSQQSTSFNVLECVSLNVLACLCVCVSVCMCVCVYGCMCICVYVCTAQL